MNRLKVSKKNTKYAHTQKKINRDTGVLRSETSALSLSCFPRSSARRTLSTWRLAKRHLARRPNGIRRTCSLVRHRYFFVGAQVGKRSRRRPPLPSTYSTRSRTTATVPIHPSSNVHVLSEAKRFGTHMILATAAAAAHWHHRKRHGDESHCYEAHPKPGDAHRHRH